MKSYFRKVGLIAAGLFVAVSLVAGARVALAAPVDDACKGLKLAEPTASCGAASAEKDGSNIAQAVINTLSIIVGVVAVIMVIIGGFRYVISNGDSNSLQGAKNSILYAIVGLVIVLFAQVIVRFVLTKATE